jgi:hypothetical protein
MHFIGMLSATEIHHCCQYACAYTAHIRRAMQIADMKSNRICTIMVQILGITGQPACFACVFVQSQLPEGSLAGSG